MSSIDKPRALFYSDNIVRIIDVKNVNIPGVLEYDINYGWTLTENNGGVKSVRILEDWLIKFQDRNIRIFIEALSEKDDTEMVEGLETKIDRGRGATERG